MSERKACKRCGKATPVIDNVEDTQTYYGFQVNTRTETTVSKTIRLFIWAIYGPHSKRARRGGARILTAGEEVPLCVDCGGLLHGRFMQGRSVPAMEGNR